MARRKEVRTADGRWHRVYVTGPGDSIYGLSLVDPYVIGWLVDGVAALLRLRRFRAVMNEGVYIDGAASLRRSVMLVDNATRREAREKAAAVVASLSRSRDAGPPTPEERV